MALTADRNTPTRLGDLYGAPVAAAALVHAGALVMLDAVGNAVPGRTATGLTAGGRAEHRADNASGLAGDVTLQIRRGVFRWQNSAAGDLIGRGDIGSACWVVDDETVAKTDGGGARSRAGLVVDVDPQGVWVLTGYGLLDALAGGLAAANNLSDLASASAARGNLGVARAWLTLDVADLASAGTLHLVAPVAGIITGIRSVIDGALAAGDATLTADIDGVAVTGGVITIAQAGSAAGDVDSAAPSAANTVDVGDTIGITVGGANTAQVRAGVIVEITY